MTSPRPIVVWFREDLRLSDHPALHAAAKAGAPVICLCVFEENAGRPLGGAARWWLAQSLRALQGSLQGVSTQLVLRKGDATGIITQVARETNAAAVYWNDVAQAPHRAVAKLVKAALADIGVTSQTFAGDLL